MQNRYSDTMYQPRDPHVFYIGGQTISPIVHNQNNNSSFGNKKKCLLAFGSFILFMNAVVTFLMPLVIITWHNYLFYIIDINDYLELIILIFVSGALNLVNGWLSTYLQKKDNRLISFSLAMFFLLMFILMLIISNIVHILGAYSNEVKFDWYPTPEWSENIIIENNSYKPHLRTGPFHSMLNRTLYGIQSQYGENKRKTWVWDRVQNDLKCCGVEGPYDWNGVRADGLIKNYHNAQYPLSCYSFGNAVNYMMPYATGCLDYLAYNYYLSLALLISANLISFVIHSFVVVIYGFCYFTK